MYILAVEVFCYAEMCQISKLEPGPAEELNTPPRPQAGLNSAPHNPLHHNVILMTGDDAIQSVCIILDELR